jgi:aspartyl-tRNA(Asn)/glutamyl-tRNA(Gln) amidotransferase subunit A
MRDDYTKALNNPITPLRIGVPACFMDNRVDTDIKQAIEAALLLFQQAGAEIIEIDITQQNLWSPCYYTLVCAEAASNLSRYDGIRFGHQASHATTIDELISRSRSEGFGREVQRRILTGTQLLSTDYYDHYYIHAQKIRRMIQEELHKILTTVDVIIGPTTTHSAFPLSVNGINYSSPHLNDGFTLGANLAGLPAISIPAGFSNGLPIGMQIMASAFAESTLLTLAHYFQSTTHFHKMKPNDFEE